jgi:hypothetical protein
MRLRTPLAVVGSAALTIGLLTATGTTPAASGSAGSAAPAAAPAVLDTYLRDTWRSFTAMVDPDTGLVSDNVAGSLAGNSRAHYTSPTNIGAYLWSTTVAQDTGLISQKEARARIKQTLKTLATLEKHEPSGMFYNWYDPENGDKLTTWPENGNVVHPFLSSVDNGWLATGLLVVARSDRTLAQRANRIRKEMDFSWFYDENAGARLTADQPVGGQISGGFWVAQPGETCAQLVALKPGTEPVYQTCHRYGAFNTEPRMASYLGIAAGQIPAKHYWGPVRTFYNDNCDYSWTETRPVGGWQTYDGIPVFEGALPYRDIDVVPTWGGSMFEALMVPLFVPEEEWGPRSWGVNHPLYVRGQIEHGLDDAQYGYWGFSPSNNPAGGYREYGVDALGMDAGSAEAGGYTSDQQRTDWNQPYEGCRAGDPTPPTAYGDGVVTPHASFLAYRYAPDAALANLAKLRANYDAYGPGGFYDAIAVGSATVSKRYLSLDQGMIMAALGNALADDDMRRYVSRGAMEDKLEPMMRQEVFAAGER